MKGKRRLSRNSSLFCHSDLRRNLGCGTGSLLQGGDKVLVREGSKGLMDFGVVKTALEIAPEDTR